MKPNTIPALAAALFALTLAPFAVAQDFQEIRPMDPPTFRLAGPFPQARDLAVGSEVQIVYYRTDEVFRLRLEPGRRYRISLRNQRIWAMPTLTAYDSTGRSLGSVRARELAYDLVIETPRLIVMGTSLEYYVRVQCRTEGELGFLRVDPEIASGW